MAQLLEMILSQEKIVPLLGVRGIGKSSLAINTLHYAAERKMFPGGILMIQLKEVRHSFAMLKLIVREVTKQMKLNNKEKE